MPILNCAAFLTGRSIGQGRTIRITSFAMVDLARIDRETSSPDRVEPPQRESGATNTQENGDNDPRDEQDPQGIPAVQQDQVDRRHFSDLSAVFGNAFIVSLGY